MKIIEPSVELIDDIDGQQILRKLELCGKVSRKSKLGDAENFVRSIIKRGHESVLEHVSLTFQIICDRAIMAELTRHRLASFTVESTRYIKYDELKFISPFKDDLVGDTSTKRFFEGDRVKFGELGSGITDKNGKEIFEGDIIQFSNGSKYAIRFVKNSFVASDAWGFYDLATLKTSEAEVVGHVDD